MPQKRLSLLPGALASYHLFYDLNEGGSTKASWSNETEFDFKCDVFDESNVSPKYCGLSLELKSFVHSSEFKDYEQVSVHIDYNGQTERLRLKLYNYLPSTRASAYRENLKLHELILPSDQTAGSILLDNHIWHYSSQSDDPAVQSYADMSFVVELMPPLLSGKHTLKLGQVDMLGPLIPFHYWVVGVGVCWLLVSLVLFLYFLLHQQKRIRNDSNRLAQLTQFSSSLQQESDEYKLLSSHDPLTNALNRHGFAQEIHQLFPESKLKLNTALLVIDLDHFKSINDNYGHDGGDEVLRMVAHTLYKNIRINDRLVRWGGEEFVLFCVDTTTQQAQLIAEKVRVAIEGCVIKYKQSEIHVTASLGVGVANHLEEFDRLFQRTDQALYEAKGMGRNCVVFSEQS